MKKWLRHIVLALALVLVISGYASARTVNGITINDGRDFDWGKQRVAEVVFYDSFDPGAAQVFNGASGTGDTAGSIPVRRYTTSGVIQVQISVLGSTSIDVQLQGQVGTDTGWFVLDEQTFTATGISHFVVGTPTDNFRIGVDSNTDGVDTITITGTFIGSREGG